MLLPLPFIVHHSYFSNPPTPRFLLTTLSPSSPLPLSPPRPLTRRQRQLLLLTAAVSSGCGLAAELLLGTLTSYLVGAQALAYGVSVGGFLAAMGLGAYLSRFLSNAKSLTPGQQQASLLRNFFTIEIVLAPLVALVPLGLFILFTLGGPTWIGLAFSTLILGLLSGMEVPLLTRLIELDAKDLSSSLAGVLALDYVGALAGSLLFPAVLLPWIGLLPSAFIIGSLPAWMIFALARAFPTMRRWQYGGVALAIFLCAITPAVLPLSAQLENKLYKAPVVWRSNSPYQRIVLTRFGQDARLFLNGELQLSTVDEYRYHESLVHPALLTAPNPKRVLLLGAGDGMALREVLKWPSIEQVTIVELDPTIINLAQTQPDLLNANQSAFSDPRVDIRYGDAFRLVPTLETQFDAIIADFPDPDEVTIAKLYSQGFYQQLRGKLAPDGVLITQASSPFFAPEVIACITETINATGLHAAPYSVDIPSFGPWGFVIATPTPTDFRTALQDSDLPIDTRFLTPDLLPTLFVLAKDTLVSDIEVNRLSNPVIVRYQSNPRWSVY